MKNPYKVTISRTWTQKPKRYFSWEKNKKALKIKQQWIFMIRCYTSLISAKDPHNAPDILEYTDYLKKNILTLRKIFTEELVLEVLMKAIQHKFITKKFEDCNGLIKSCLNCGSFKDQDIQKKLIN